MVCRMPGCVKYLQRPVITADYLTICQQYVSAEPVIQTLTATAQPLASKRPHCFAATSESIAAGKNRCAGLFRQEWGEAGMIKMRVCDKDMCEPFTLVQRVLDRTKMFRHRRAGINDGDITFP